MASGKHEPGFTVFLTGLPAAGKSSIAKFLQLRLMEMGSPSVHLLDGDHVRKTVSLGLGFSPEDRNENIRRMAAVAAEIAKSGGISICAAIAPYDFGRKDVRRIASAAGGFFLVYVSTPLTICESRDPKGDYARARAGILTNFTGVSDPYEPPDDAEITIDTTSASVNVTTEMIVSRVRSEGYMASLNQPRTNVMV